MGRCHLGLNLRFDRAAITIVTLRAPVRPGLAPAALLTGAVLLLTGCRVEDARAPFTDSRIPPGLEQRFYPPDGWAWGLIKVGKAPAARYGVCAPPMRPRADVLILTGHGEPAEEWFETARALGASGYVVWVLEPIGEGGSARWALPRDLRHASSLEPDAAAAKAMGQKIVGRRPLIVLASQTSAPTALAALASGLQADGLILSSPTLAPAAPPPSPRDSLMLNLGLGGFRAPGAAGWKRDGPDDRALGLTHDIARGRVRLAWQMANPDLRMGGPSLSWQSAFAAAASQAQAPGAVRLTVPTLVLAPTAVMDDGRRICLRLNQCSLQPFGPAGGALHLEVDEVRKAWLGAVQAFIEPNIARFSPPPVGASGA
jgi:lysophospholipase